MEVAEGATSSITVVRLMDRDDLGELHGPLPFRKLRPLSDGGTEPFL